MKVVKKKINNYDIYIENTDKYPRIYLSFFFEIPYTKENIYTCDVLGEYMLYTCKKYKTKKEIRDMALKMYSMSFAIHNFNVGEKLFIEVAFHFYDPHLVKDDYLYEALKFASDLLTLNCENNALQKEDIEYGKSSIISSLSRNIMSNKTRASNSFKRLAYKDTYITRDLLETKDEIMSTIANISEQDLINMYNQIYKKSLIGVFLMGNIEDEYLEYISKIFKFDEVKKLDKDYQTDVYLNKDTPADLSVEDKDYKESILRVVFDAPSTTYKESMTYNVINRMLSSEGLILHKILRDKYKLVYQVESIYNKHTHSLIIRAYIDGKNKNQTIDAIDEAMSILKNDDVIEELLDQIKEKIEMMLYTQDERPYAVFEELISSTLEFDVPDEIFLKTIKSLQVSDIKNGLDKLEKCKIHFYEGVKK